MKPFWSTGNSVRHVAFSPDSKKIACLRSSDIYVCDLELIEKSRVIVPAQEAEISQIEWSSSDSKSLAILQRESSIVIIAKFQAESLVDDEERWVDLKSAGHARCCAWNPANWIAIASSSGRIFLSHESEGSKWGQTTASGPVSAIAASNLYWALAIPKEGIWLCNVTDCLLVRRVVGSYIGLTRSLEFSPSSSELLMAYDGKQCAIVSARSKRFVPVDIGGGHVSACAWLCNQSSSLLVVKTEPEIELLQLFVQEVQQTSDGTYQINVATVRSVLLRVGTLSSRVFELNASSQTITGSNIFGEGRCDLFVALYSCENDDLNDDLSASSMGDLAITSIKYVRKNALISNFIVSPNSLFAAMTTNSGIVQLFRLLNNNEQITEVLTRNLTPVECILQFMIPGLLGLLLFLAAFVNGSPWQALEVGFEKFCGMHFRL